MDNVADERDRILFDEAKKCQEARAFRAAFILTWIAVAEGLRWRFTEMSQRDGKMAQWVEETDRLERDGATIDQRLLDKAENSGLVSDPEFKKLTYLKDMRNSFAHPTGAAPTQSEVAAAFQVAVDTILSRPPLLGHGFARELTDILFRDRHFLDDVEDKVTSYVDQLRLLLNPEVIPWLAEQLVTRLDSTCVDPQLDVFTRRAIWFTSQLLAAADFDSSPKWRIEKMLNDHPIAACLILGDTRIFPRIGPQLGDRVFGWLAEPTSEGQVLQPSIVSLTMLISLADAQLLDQRQQSRLSEVIGGMPYPTLQQGAPFRVWVRKVITDIETHSWYVQNPAASAINTAGPAALESCESSVLEALGRGLLAATDGAANEARALMSRLYSQDGHEWPTSFIKGLLFETVLNEDGTFRVKPTFLPYVAKIVNSHPGRDIIIADVMRAISEVGPPANRRSAIRNGLEELDVIQPSGGQEVVEALAEAARALMPEIDTHAPSED